MTQEITNKGRQLALALKVFTYADQRTCSQICRAAASYMRLQEDSCNGHPAQRHPAPAGADHKEYWARVTKMQEKWDARIEKRESQIEALIKQKAATLPGIVGVRFQGDPRGATVKLLRETDSSADHSSDGVPVPGS